MIDWHKSMQRTYEFYIVDPDTWFNKRKLTTVTSASIDWDEDDETLGSASFDCTEELGECYIRIYQMIIQNGTTYQPIPMGTFLVQTPSISFDGKVTNISLDAYTPLLELKEDKPPIGYTVGENEKTLVLASNLCREHARAPVVASTDTITTIGSNFVAYDDDTWLSFISDLLSKTKKRLALDDMGRILFMPKQDIASLKPLWIYNDNNSSILQSDISIARDLYGVPNVVEIIYSINNVYKYASAINEDPNSPTSTINRGRRIVTRITNPDITPSQDSNTLQRTLNDYANQTLRDLSSVEYTVSYSHGYNPVKIGDCVLLNYERAGLKNIKAKVTSQSITCDSQCQVSEVAVYTKKLWG